MQTIAAPDGTISRTFYPVGDYRAGQIQSETRNGQTKYFDYDAAGRMFRIWGTGEYPREYGYDDAGRMAALRTYRNEAGWTGAAWPSGADLPEVCKKGCVKRDR